MLPNFPVPQSGELGSARRRRGPLQGHSDSSALLRPFINSLAVKKTLSPLPQRAACPQAISSPNNHQFCNQTTLISQHYGQEVRVCAR